MSNINGNIVGNINPQSDWNQNDSTLSDYIKNKPFYKEDVIVNYTNISCTEPNSITGFSAYNKKLNLTANNTYTIDLIRDSGITTVELIASTISQYGLTANVLQSSDILIIDGIVFDDSYNPSPGDGVLYQLYDNSIKNIKVYGIESSEIVVHTIPQEYLDLNGLIPEMDLNNYYEKETINLFKDSGFSNLITSQVTTGTLFDEDYFVFDVIEFPDWNLKIKSSTAGIQPCIIDNGLITINDSDESSHTFKQTISNLNFEDINLFIEYLNSSYLKILIDNQEVFNQTYNEAVENINIPLNISTDNEQVTISIIIDNRASIKNPQLLVKLDSIKKYIDMNKFSGSYNDLIDVPEDVQSDWNQTDSTSLDYIKNKPIYKETTTSNSCIFDQTSVVDYINDSESFIYRELKHSTLNLQIDNKYDIEYLDMSYGYMKSITSYASFINDKNDKTIPTLSISSEFEIYDKATLDKDGNIVYGDGIVYKVIYQGAIKIKNINYVEHNVTKLDNEYLNIDEIGHIIDTNGGITNITPATIKGYKCGGNVKGFHPLHVELVVCEVNHDTGEFISLKDTITATYDISDPENRAAGIYNYKGIDYELSNVTSSTEVSEKLGFNDNERICLKVEFSNTSEMTVGMSYNLYYPVNSKQRYGKIIAILDNNYVVLDGECNAIHRSYTVNNVVFPITSTQYNGNFIINGGLIGDFEITESNGVSLYSEGIQTYSSIGGHSEGHNTKALGFASHVEGEESIASGYGSHAEGAASHAEGHQSHAEGERTEAKGYASHAEGQQSVATGSTSHAEGNMTIASGRISHSEGNNTKATNNYTHAEGHYTEASGMASHAEGGSTKVISAYGHVEGNNNIVGQDVETEELEVTIIVSPEAGGNDGITFMGSYIKSDDTEMEFDCHIEKGENSASIILNDAKVLLNSYTIFDYESGSDVVTSRYQVTMTSDAVTIVQGAAAHAEGQDNKAFGDFSHAEGRGTTSSGIASHTEGQATKATEKQSHAEGYQTEAFGDRAHAEGNSTKAHGSISHAEGYSTEATGQYTHSEGWLSKATGQVGHAEGYKTEAKGRFSHAEGRETLAGGTAAHASGLGTIANGANQTASGKYNKSNTSHLHIVGKGTSDTDRVNAYVLDKDGQGYFAGDVYVGDATTLKNAKKLATEEYVNKYVTENASGGNASDEYNLNNIMDADGTGSIRTVGTTQVIGDYSTAFGLRTSAGLNGYYWYSVDFENNTITLTKTQNVEPTESFEIDYAIGDVVTLVNGSKYEECATIKTISGNVITLDKLPFTSVVAVSDWGIDDRSLHVPAKPEIGFVTLSNSAHAEGEDTFANDRGAHAEGRKSKAIGQYSHAEGRETVAYYASHAEGLRSKALAQYAHAEGAGSEVTANTGHAEGNATKVKAKCGHAEGSATTVHEGAENAHVEGYGTEAYGTNAHAEGFHTQAKGSGSHAEGNGCTAAGRFAHAEGQESHAGGDFSHAENRGAAYADSSHAEGTGQAHAVNSHAEGVQSITYGEGSHAEGGNSITGAEDSTSGRFAHAEGYHSTALGNYAHAEGNYSEANGEASHAESKGRAYATNSHAEGNSVVESSATNAHAEGTGTSSGVNSHSEGSETRAIGHSAHAEGGYTQALSTRSHAEGYNTIADGADGQHVQGRLNIQDTKGTYAHIVGNGDPNFMTRSNAHALDWKGNAYYAGKVYIGNASPSNDGTISNAKELATIDYVDNKISGIVNVWTTIGTNGDIKPEEIDTVEKFVSTLSGKHNVILLEDIIVKYNSTDLNSSILNLSNMYMFDLNGYTLTLLPQIAEEYTVITLNLPKIFKNGTIKHTLGMKIYTTIDNCVMDNVILDTVDTVIECEHSGTFSSIKTGLIGEHVIHVLTNYCKIRNCENIGVWLKQDVQGTFVTENILTHFTNDASSTINIIVNNLFITSLENGTFTLSNSQEN